MIMIMFIIIDNNYPSFNCAPLKMDLTALNKVSKIALVLNRASLDMICTPSIFEEQDAIFEPVFTAFRYIFNRAQLKEG